MRPDRVGTPTATTAAGLRGPFPPSGRRALSLLARHAILVVLLIEVALFSAFVPRFLTVTNLLNTGRAVAVLGITAAGATIGLLSGALDLSVGSVMVLSGMVAALLLDYGLPMPAAVACCLAVGLGAGLTNGFVVTKLRINPIVCTLGTMTIFRGMAILSFGPQGIRIDNPSYRIFAESVVGVPLPVILLVIVYLVFYVTLTQTRFGRYVYAVGRNPDASRAAAIPVDRLRISYLAISGLMAAVAGLVLSSMGGAAVPTAAAGFELSVITAVILGGISLAGGIGTIQGTAIGVLIIGFLVNGMSLAGIRGHYQMLLQGLVLLLVVFIDARRTGGYK